MDELNSSLIKKKHLNPKAVAMLAEKKTKNIALFALLVMSTYTLNINAQSMMSQFKDTTDNAFDVSEWLLKKEGFLPVPTIITEPAVGYGAGAAVVFFHSSFLDRKGPPNMSGGFGGYTSNDTWAAGIFHAGYWNEDRIRYVGALMRMNVNIDFYGSGLILGNNPIEMNMDAWLLFQQLKFRVADSDFFIGGRYFLYDTKNTFEIPIDIPAFQGRSINSTLSEVTLILNYDSRNNVMTPTKGLFAELTGSYSADWLGVEGEYGRAGLAVLGFTDISPRFNLGLRYEGTHTNDASPFWARPIVAMRGVPAMKYQNKHISLAETELTYKVYKRWYLNAFTGMGIAYSDFDKYADGSSVRTIGTGFRYEIARIFGLRGGMDFAWSNDDFAFYFMVGHA